MSLFVFSDSLIRPLVDVVVEVFILAAKGFEDIIEEEVGTLAVLLSVSAPLLSP
jgi:methylaspartate ammonia-lyase